MSIDVNLTEILNWRYSTKAFQAGKTIPEKTWDLIEDSLRFAASSTNAQPWHFIVAATDEGKTRLAKGTEDGFAFNTQKILDASHVVLFCAKTDLSEDYLLSVLEQEKADGRFQSSDFPPEKMHQGRSHFVNIHKDKLDDVTDWNEKQVYLNIGSTLLAASALKVDSVPMEGIDAERLDKEFDLSSKGLKASVMVAFGYRSDSDFNAKLPKSRLEKSEIITRI